MSIELTCLVCGTTMVELAVGRWTCSYCGAEVEVEVEA